MLETLRPFLKLSDAVVITDCRHHIVDVNASYEQITGYTRSEVIGHPAGMVGTKLTPCRTYESMKQALASNQAWSGIFTNRKKNGDIWHSSITVTPFRSGRELLYVGIFRELEQLNEGLYLGEDGKDRLQGALLKMLAMSCEIRDPGIEEHLLSVQMWSGRLLQEYNRRTGNRLSPVFQQAVCHASILHDIGKSGIPEGILYKPGPLAPYERMIIETHPQIGADILHKVTLQIDEPWLAREWETARNIIMYHHEKWNGTGYPSNLSGRAIPLEARIVSIVDVFDALVSRRPYKDRWCKADALKYIESQRGISFDPELVDAFQAMSLDRASAVN